VTPSPNHPAARALFAAERLTGWAESFRLEATDLQTQADNQLANAAALSTVDPVRDAETAYGHALADLARLRAHQADVLDGTAEAVRADDADERRLRVVDGGAA
jgi:hypothetical protein